MPHAHFISVHDNEVGLSFHAAKLPQINGLFTVLARVQQHPTEKQKNLTHEEADSYIDNFVRLASKGKVVYESDDTKYPVFGDLPSMFR